MRPDVARVTSLFAALPCMHNDKCVDESVAVVVIKSVIHLWVSGYSRVFRHYIRSRDTRGSGNPEVVVCVPPQRVRQSEWPHNFTNDVHKVGSDLMVVLFYTAVLQHPRREKQIIEMRSILANCMVRELYKHDDNPNGAAERCAISRRCTDRRVRSANRKLVRRHDNPVVEAQTAWSSGNGE